MDIPRRTASPELRSILLQTVGVLGRLGEVLSGLEGADKAGSSRFFGMTVG